MQQPAAQAQPPAAQAGRPEPATLQSAAGVPEAEAAAPPAAASAAAAAPPAPSAGTSPQKAAASSPGMRKMLKRMRAKGLAARGTRAGGTRAPRKPPVPPARRPPPQQLPLEPLSRPSAASGDTPPKQADPQAASEAAHARSAAGSAAGSAAAAKERRSDGDSDGAAGLSSSSQWRSDPGPADPPCNGDHSRGNVHGLGNEEALLRPRVARPGVAACAVVGRCPPPLLPARKVGYAMFPLCALGAPRGST